MSDKSVRTPISSVSMIWGPQANGTSICFSVKLQEIIEVVGIDSNRAPSVPNASTLSITPKRSSSRDV
ncbi:hypothetical protein TNCV_3586141 [Trichonephila clavipes]|nr:hypothetical protein TNCV_3586141 [Trichonephila clavipes]